MSNNKACKHASRLAAGTAARGARLQSRHGQDIEPPNIRWCRQHPASAAML